MQNAQERLTFCIDKVKTLMAQIPTDTEANRQKKEYLQKIIESVYEEIDNRAYLVGYDFDALERRLSAAFSSLSL
jgi:hypothetical protein